MKNNLLHTYSVTLSVILILTIVFPTVGHCTDPVPDCPSNLLFLLRLDETSGPDYADYYGIHNAVAEVSPTSVSGKLNKAQLFDNDTKLNIADNGTELTVNSTLSNNKEILNTKVILTVSFVLT